ncbi:hypothetical protein [Chengkuizengella sediminis]|uniref:hypothetical protein n=1 Tax=Chengkuizengella sediminis TaxID=1885917 RepID=UPI001389E40D|nr:hypothetical protein [Chengkuizengella sediminis]NDI34255.1 hypothetical protein [Chengkuizengella sediminis]
MKLFAAVALSSILDGAKISTDAEVMKDNKSIVVQTDETESRNTPSENHQKKLINKFAVQLGINTNGKSVNKIKDELNQICTISILANKSQV